MKRRSAYANMTASDLARITRERGLEKPNVVTLGEWADFLEADDKRRAQAKDSAAEGDKQKTVQPADVATPITDDEAAALPDAQTEDVPPTEGDSSKSSTRKGK